MSDYVIVPAGDAALLVRVGAVTDEATNREVLALAGALRRSLDGVPDLDVTPAYRSLLVSFRPGALTDAELRRAIDRTSATDVEELEPKMLVIPVAYGGEHGPDLEFVAQFHALTAEAVVGLHASREYRIYCLGFSPGFPFLGGLAESLNTPRLPAPRVQVPAGSVAIAGTQTGVYPTATPGGWRIIGRTPLVLFDPHRDPPTDYRPGHYLRFEPITDQGYADLLRLRLSPGDYSLRVAT
jgi:inhibitor of KinA